MSHPTIARVRQQPTNLITEQVERLRAIFPDVFSEDRVDFDKLNSPPP